VENAALVGHALEMRIQGTLQPVGAVTDHSVCGGLGDSCAVELAKACLPGVGPFAFRYLPMHDCPVPIGPHATCAEPHPLLFALDRATPALGIEAALARGRGNLNPQAIDQEHRWRTVQGLRLAPCEGLGHTRHQTVTGRKGAYCPHGHCHRFLHVP